MADETESTYYLLDGQENGAIDGYGLYATSLNFNWTEGTEEEVTAATEGLAEGSMTIVEDYFQDIYGNDVILYPSVGIEVPSFEHSTEQGATTYAEITYSDEEEAGLRAKFGGNYEHPVTDGSGQELDAAVITNNLVESYINAAVEEIATTALKPQFSFKKVRYEELDYDHLSTFEETEATQTAATSLVQTTEGTY